MAIQNILNGSGGQAQYMLSPEDYNPTQSNVLGQDLAPTPTDNGQQISVDYTNDGRTAQDYKQQAMQAQQDASASADDSHKLKGESGFSYEKVDSSRVNQMLTAIAAFGVNYIGSDDGGANAVRAAGMAVNDLVNQGHRQSQIKDLEAKGYNPVDIQRWIETGNTKDLLTNKGKETVQNGFLVNDLTGTTKKLGLNSMQEAGLQMDQAQLQEQQRHNLAGEHFEAARVGMEQQRLNLATQRLNGGDGSSPASAQAVSVTNANGEQVTAPAGMYNDHLAVMTNSRGTPLMDAKAGTVQVKDINTGRTFTVVQDTTAANAAAQTATTGQGIIKELEDSGNLSYTGGYGIQRGAANVLSGNELTPTLKSQIDSANGTVEAAIEARLAVENKGKQVTKPQIEAQKNAIGYLSIDNTPEQNAAILKRQKKFLAQTVSRADELTGRNQEEYTNGNANYHRDNNPPTSAYGVNAPQPQQTGTRSYSHLW